tara:strand:+ start:470 stop:1345 length:876 start_codon:yes stop_codon:yes gene_type:complete
MSNELSTNFAGSDLAAAMGFGEMDSSTSSAPKIPILNQVQAAIMVEHVVDDEVEEKVVVPLGAYCLKDVEGNEVYSRSVSIRLLAQRQQWTQFDTDIGRSHNTVMVIKLKGDLKDSRGTFNLGRDSKYRTPEEWAVLDDDYKARQSSVKNSKVLFGKVSMNKPFDAKGNPMQGYDGEIDFVYYVKNFQSKKSIDAALQEITSKKLLPIEHTIKLTSKKEKMSTNSYATVVASLGSKVSMKEDDQDALRSFIDFIDYKNDYVLSEWKKLNKPDVAISPDVLDAIVQVEEAPY